MKEHQNDIFCNLFGKAFGSIYCQPTILWSSVFGRQVYATSGHSNLAYGEIKDRSLYASYYDIVRLKNKFGAIIPLPPVVSMKEWQMFFNIMALDLFELPENVPKSNKYIRFEDFHYYDPNLFSSQNLHLSSNIPNYVAVIGTALLLFSSWEEHLVKTHRRIIRDSSSENNPDGGNVDSIDIDVLYKESGVPFTIAKDKYFIRTNCRKVAEFFHQSFQQDKIAYEEADVEKTNDHFVDGEEIEFDRKRIKQLKKEGKAVQEVPFEIKVRWNHEKSFLKEPTKFCYLEDLEMKFWFVRGDCETIGKPHLDENDGGQATQYTLSSLAEIAFNPAKYKEHAFWKLDPIFHKLLNHLFDPATLRDYLRLPYSNLALFGKRDAFVAPHVKELCDKLGLPFDNNGLNVSQKRKVICSKAIEFVPREKNLFSHSHEVLAVLKLKKNLLLGRKRSQKNHPIHGMNFLRRIKLQLSPRLN
jgi:hypothetical protein